METIEVGHKIQAILAEYNALRAEIQQRSDFQHRILQLHITTLALVLGAAVSQPLGYLIFLLVPITTSLFGLWWFDNKRAIREIGLYIESAIESRMNNLLKEDTLMFWESRGTALSKPIFSKRRLYISAAIPSITFAWPSFITLIIGAIMLLPKTTILNFGPALFNTEWCIALAEELAGVFLFIIFILPVQLQPQYKSKVVATSK